jgi:hypothetical protein
MSNERGRPRSKGNGLRLVLGLALTPCLVALAAGTLPALHVGARLADVIAFAGAALVPIVALAIAATAEASLAIALSIAAAAAALLIAVGILQPPPGSGLLPVDTALVCLSWALGTSLGRRVQHPAHLLPACVVAASADLVSLLSPEGPSHAIAQSDRALSVLAVWFPVPGSPAVAPALGIGDLLFMALILGVARAHGLPYIRSVVACVIGTALAGLAAACLGVAVPALVPIAASVIVGLPVIRRLRKADRSAALLSMLIAGSLAVASIARSWFGQR